jgi:hypothetical protein
MPSYLLGVATGLTLFPFLFVAIVWSLHTFAGPIHAANRATHNMVEAMTGRDRKLARRI